MNSKQLNEFFVSISNAIGRTDSGTYWPGGGGQIGSSFIAIDALVLHNQLLELKKIKRPCDLVDYFYCPSIIRYVCIGNFIIGLKVLLRDKKITMAAAKESLEFFLDILDSKVSKDPFCLNNKNLWFDDSKVSGLMQEIRFNKVNSSELGLISRLVIALSSLVWSFYYDIYVEAGFEFHGPYDVELGGKKYSLLIRDYYDLRPTDLWNKAKEFGFKSVRLYLLYSGVNISLDFFMHEFSDKPLRESLAYYAIETIDLNGKKSFVSIKDAVVIAELAEKITVDQVAYVNQLSVIETINMGAMICYYQLKDFRGRLGVDWRPPKEVFDAIKDKGLEKWEKYKARAVEISAGTANIDWGAKYRLDSPL